MPGRRAPVPLSALLAPYTERLDPKTPLSVVMSVWSDALSPTIAAEAQPQSVRGGTVSAACSSATWAHQLTMLEPQLVEQLNEKLTEAPLEDGGTLTVRRIRFSARGFAG